MKLFIDIVMKRIYLFYIVAWNYRKKIGFPVCKKENFAGLQAHRKRGKSARASPTPHHTLNPPCWPPDQHPTFRPSAPQAYQCLISHFLASLTWYCTSMFWLIESCQINVSADRYRLTVSWAQVSTHCQFECFLKVSADKLLLYKWPQAQVQYF